MTFPLEIKRTFPEHWPIEILEMSFDSETIAVSSYDARILGSFSSGFVAATGFLSDDFFSNDFLNEIENRLKKFCNGVMPRIGPCSWKYSMLLNEPACDLDAVLSIISKDDSRVGRAIAQELITGDTIYFYLREWHNIPPWSEFRIFIRDRRIIGISQYHHRSAYLEIHQNAQIIKAALADFSRDLIDALHMDTVVADVFIEKQSNGRLQTTLIELNPFIQRTDPCLYTWKNGGDFDGGFRYYQPKDGVYSTVTPASKNIDDPWQLPADIKRKP